jgi:hypothetical protein
MENKQFQFYVQEVGTSMAPQYVERVSRSGWITYGDDNLYPDYLVSLMNRSAKHNAILKRKNDMISGGGWIMEGLDAIAINFLYNPYNEYNLDEIVSRTSYDLEIFGAFCLEIIYSKDKTKIAEINYLPVNKIRLSECGKYVYYCNDWSNIRKFAPIKYPVYNPKTPTTNQILYFKEYRPGVEYYGQPDYISSVNWIELEWEISQYHLGQVKNGFSPGMIINFTNGVPSSDEMQDIIRQLRSDFEGAKNSGKTMFLFSDGEDRAAKITPVALNNSDERFIELNKEITQGILTGHQITNPIIMGVAVPGELGAKNEIIEAVEVFQSMYVNPKQKIVQGVYNKLLKVNGSTSKLELKKYEIDIQKIEEGTTDERTID